MRLQDVRANTAANQKTVQGVQTPRWRKVEAAARRDSAGKVDFHSMVESRTFEQREVGHQRRLSVLVCIPAAAGPDQHGRCCASLCTGALPDHQGQQWRTEGQQR